MNRRPLRPNGRTRRRGAIIVMVVLLLLVVVGVAGAVLQGLLAEQRQSRALHQQHQAVWLAEAGVQRAAAQLRDAAAYSGETWLVPAETFHGHREGSVEIRVERLANEPDQHRIHVVADYPTDTVHRKRCRRTVVIALDRSPHETEQTGC